MFGKNACRERDGAGVAEAIAGGQREVDLAHQLVAKAEAIDRFIDRCGLDVRERREGDISGARDHGIEIAGVVESSKDACGIGEIDREVARISAGFDDFVPER